MKLYYYILFFYTTIYGQKYEFDHSFNYNLINSKGIIENFSISINSNDSSYYLYIFKDDDKNFRSLLRDKINNKIHSFVLDHANKEKFIYLESIKINVDEIKNQNKQIHLMLRSNLTYKDSIFEEHTSRLYNKNDSIMVNVSKILIKKDKKVRTINQLNFLKDFITNYIIIDESVENEFYKIISIKSKYSKYNTFLELENDYEDVFSLNTGVLTYKKKYKLIERRVEVHHSITD